MHRHLPALALAGLAFSWSAAAHAEDFDFGYSYGAQTTEQGETEISLWATDRRGKGKGHYDAQDYRLEIERGITDRVQASLYVNLASHHVRRLEPRFEDHGRNFGLQGLSAEFKYNLIKPGGRRIGLAVYAEPGWARIDHVSGEGSTEYELELKAIVEKDFGDRLVWVGNLTLEPEWEREAAEPASRPDEQEWKKELKVQLTTGLAYRMAPNWSVGLEGRYHSVYPDWMNGLHRDTYAVSAGPTVHYSAGKLGVTATFLPQLFGPPQRPGSHLSLDEYEKREFRLKVGYEF